MGANDIKLTLEDEGWSGYYPKNLIRARASMIWSDKEKAFLFALEKAKKEQDYLNRKIDGMISVYDEIEKKLGKKVMSRQTKKKSLTYLEERMLIFRFQEMQTLIPKERKSIKDRG